MSKQRQLPPGLTYEQLMRLYKRELTRHSAALLTELRELFRAPREATVHSAHVEVFPDEYGDGVLDVRIFFDGTDKRLTDEAGIFSGKTHRLCAHAAPLPRVDVADCDERDIGVRDLVVDVIKYWFAEWWWKAGGWSLDLPVTLAGHDGFGDGEIVDLTEACVR